LLLVEGGQRREWDGNRGVAEPITIFLFLVIGNRSEIPLLGKGRIGSLLVKACEPSADHRLQFAMRAPVEVEPFGFPEFLHGLQEPLFGLLRVSGCFRCLHKAFEARVSDDP
jgi:hypothetical protein